MIWIPRIVFGKMKTIEMFVKEAIENEPFDCGALTKEQWLEKFTELIVRECSNVALREDHEPDECILHHFGLRR